MRPLRMSYGCLTNVLRLSYDSILIAKMLKFKIKTIYETNNNYRSEWCR